MNDRQRQIYVFLILIIPTQVALFLFRWVSRNEYWNSFPKEKGTYFLISAVILLFLCCFIFISTLKAKEEINQRTVLPMLVKFTLALAALAIGVAILQELFLLF